MDLEQIGGPIILFFLMMVVGMDLTPADFRRVFETPRAVIGGTLGQWVLLPLLTWLVVEAVGVNPVFGAGAILVALSPGAGMSNILAALGRANVALSVTLTALASVFAVVTLPAIASLGMRIFLDEALEVEVPVGALVAQLAVSLLLPIGAGMGLRLRRPESAAWLRPRLLRATFLAAGGFVAFAVATAPEEQRSFEGGELAALAAVVWTLAALFIGWAVAALLRLPPADRFTLAIEFSARNVAVATIVAMSGLERLDLTYFSGIYFAVGYPLTVTIALLRRRATA